MTTMYLLSDVARLMRKRPHQITYAITSGLLPEPELRMGGRRVFQKQDIERIARRQWRHMRIGGGAVRL